MEGIGKIILGAFKSNGRAGVYWKTGLALLLLLAFLTFPSKHPEPYLKPCISPYEVSTTLAGGIPGFYVFDHVWYHGGDFYMFTSKNIPDRDEIFSGNTGMIHTSWDPEAHAGALAATCLEGSTIFLNDGNQPGVWSYLNWYYHFAAEALLGGFTSLASIEHAEIMLGERGTSGAKHVRALSGEVPRLVIPWEENWKDGYGVNEAIVEAGFPRVILPKNWKTLSETNTTQSGWVHFPRVVFVDRYASHRYNTLAQQWNKMSLDAFNLSHDPSFLDRFREQVFQSLSIKTEATKRVKLAYIDRQASSRKLRDGDHEGLLEVVVKISRELGDAFHFVHLKLEELDKKAQIEALSDADILIGVHGNGLTHMLWMPPHGVIIEIFAPASFLRDYQVVAEALSHTHIATWNDSIHTREQWEQHIGQLNPEILHDGTPLPLDTGFIERLLGDIINAMHTR